MDVRELRIGNYVHNNVESFDIQAKDLVFLLAFDNEHYAEPIPLTEKWFLKFGFERNGKLWEIDSINGIIFEIEYVSDCYYLHTGGEWGYQGFLHVHELQNLYHSLTGQELTIK